MSPQVVLKKPFTTKADIWSLGALCYYLLCGKHAFPHESTSAEFNQRLEKGELRFSEPEWTSISLEAQDFIKSCMAVEEKDRKEPADLLKTKWIT
mmetsp:Transcript_42323/g.30549  ORF Transcript_42323/g.30549 Transcript_42323/m.30549 type:complete len:95 (-) Transcript_42323:984-1268(-)